VDVANTEFEFWWLELLGVDAVGDGVGGGVDVRRRRMVAWERREVPWSR